MDVSGHMPVTVCMCVCVRQRELSLFYTLTGNKSASSHIYMLCITYPVLHQSGYMHACVCLCVCACVCQGHPGSVSVNKQQLVKSEGMTRCLEGDKDGQKERGRREGEMGERPRDK